MRNGLETETTIRTPGLADQLVSAGLTFKHVANVFGVDRGTLTSCVKGQRPSPRLLRAVTIYVHSVITAQEIALAVIEGRPL